MARTSKQMGHPAQDRCIARVCLSPSRRLRLSDLGVPHCGLPGPGCSHGRARMPESLGHHGAVLSETSRGPVCQYSSESDASEGSLRDLCRCPTSLPDMRQIANCCSCRMEYWPQPISSTTPPLLQTSWSCVGATSSHTKTTADPTGSGSVPRQPSHPSTWNGPGPFQPRSTAAFSLTATMSKSRRARAVWRRRLLVTSRPRWLG